MLKILCIINDGYPLAGGAQTGSAAFLKVLSRRFHCDCYLYTDSRFKVRRSCGDVKLRTFRDLEELKSMTLGLRPDAIIASKEISHYALKLARQLNIPAIVYMHDYLYCPPNAEEERAWKFDRQRSRVAEREIDFVLKEADAILVNSRYLKKRFQKRCGIRTRVIYNEFDRDEFLVKDAPSSGDGYITGIHCLSPHKGADIFIELARIFKKEKFLISVAGADKFRGREFLKRLQRCKSQKNIAVVPFGRIKKYLGLSKIVLVPSQWPEPFGRIAVEAMACGIPVLASYNGGLKEIVRDSSLAVKDFRKIGPWRRKLSALLSSPAVYELNAKEGRILAGRFLKGESALELNALIKGLIAKKKKITKQEKTIAFCGGTTKKSAYSVINAAWTDTAKDDKEYAVISLENPKDFSHLPVDCFIYHDYSQDFKKVSLPEEGKFIAVKTWDFGKFPAAWVKKINEECDQLWVHTKWIKKMAVNSGIPAGMIKVIPHGIEHKIFRPQGRVYPLPTKKSFKFIFVGGTVERKGVDILLDAYSQAFTASDDVSLVIKDNARDVLYKGMTLRNKILKAAKKRNGPEIIYINRYFSIGELASLYRACNAGVFPYRAEGFAMPILEAMACGVPCIVPRFGACLDFCHADNSFLMPVKRINVPVNRTFEVSNQGYTEEVSEIDLCEVSTSTLANYMRTAYNLSGRKLCAFGRRAAKTAHGHFKWSDTFGYVKKSLKALERRKVPVRLLRQRTEDIKAGKNLSSERGQNLNQSFSVTIDCPHPC